MHKGIVVTLAVLALGGVLAASLLRDSDRRRGTKVYTETVERRDITQVVKASGQLNPRVKVDLSAHVVAKIERLYVEEGDEVTAGQPVLDLEQEAFLAVHDRAAAQLQIARTQLRRAEVELRDAAVKLERSRRLEAEGVLAPEQREAAELRHASAELGLQQAREEIDRVRADLEKARDDLDKVTLYAPISGRLIVLNAEQGEVVVSGTMNNPASVIGTIADLSEIIVEVDVDETEVVHVAPGQTGRVLVDALPDAEYRGTVVEVGSSGYSRSQQPDVTFFKVELLLDRPDPQLRPGMSARAEIDVDTRADALVAPIQAVVYRRPVAGAEGDEEEQAVFLLTDGDAEQRPVRTGLADATHIEITSGLEAGDTVITGPYRALRDLGHGDAVKPRDDTGKEDRP